MSEGLCIDLCSGLGSWGDDFIRIDIDPSVKPDIRNATTNFYSNNKGLKRAKIPQPVRQAILESLGKAKEST